MYKYTFYLRRPLIDIGWIGKVNCEPNRNERQEGGGGGGGGLAVSQRRKWGAKSSLVTLVRFSWPRWLPVPGERGKNMHFHGRVLCRLRSFGVLFPALVTRLKLRFYLKWGQRGSNVCPVGLTNCRLVGRPAARFTSYSKCLCCKIKREGSERAAFSSNAPLGGRFVRKEEGRLTISWKLGM